MPSVDTIASPSVIPTATAGGGASLFGGAGSSSGSGVFAALMGGATNGLVEALDAMGTTSKGATPTTSSLRRKGSTATSEETSATDLAGALAMLVGGGLQVPTADAGLGSAATLGADATTQRQTADESARVTPTKASTGAGLTVAAAATSAIAAGAAGNVAEAVAEAVAALIAAGDGAAVDPATAEGAAGPPPDASPTTGTASTTTTASNAATTRSDETNLPPALATAIARAGVGATPDALRHLTGTRVSDADQATGDGGTTTATAEPTTIAGLRGTAATAVADGEVIAAATPAAGPAKGSEKSNSATSADSVRPERALVTSGETRRVDPSAVVSDAGSTTKAPHGGVGGTGETVAASADTTSDTTMRDVTPFVGAERRDGASDQILASAAQGLDAPSVSPAMGMAHDIARDRGIGPVAMAADAGADTARAVPLAQVAETIATRSHAGHSRFDIRLSPEDLGGVDVRVEVRASGEVRAHLVVERTETLDLMLRDQRHLERSLADAGLDVGSSGLQFSLKQQPSGDGGQGWRAYDDAHARGEIRRDTAADESPAVAATAAMAYRNTRVGGIDLMV